MKCTPLWDRALVELLESRTHLTTVPAGFADLPFISGLSAPTSMAFAPDGRLFVTQKGGTIRVVKNDSLLGTPFASLTVDSAGERGLLGLDFDPDFATNGFVYVYHTVPGTASHNRVSRFSAADADPGPGYAPGDVSDGTAPVARLDIESLSSATNHNGGAIHFGPDGKLYVAVGDNATSANAQTLANRKGKILRINSDGTIPTDNPFFNTATGDNRSIWALGLRNPYTFAFHPGTGRMFINDVGQNTWEEIDEGGAARNYGWPTTEGDFTQSDFPSFTKPVYSYHHGTDEFQGNVITGGAFYNPPVVNFPASYVGTYFFADNARNWINNLLPVEDNSVAAFGTGAAGPVDLDVGADGTLYYLNINTGVVGRIVSTTAKVLSRSLFYNNSFFDGDNAGSGPSDDAAIASNKSALLPGGSATSANVSGYDKGINGVMADVLVLPAGVTPGSADFTIDVSSNGGTWITGPTPTVSLRRGAGVNHSDRVTLIWPDGSIKNTWLRITMKATAATGLANADTWYFGSALGDTGNALPGDTALNVDATDYFAIRDHLRSYDNPAPATWNWDINHDGVADGQDLLLVRANATTASTALQLITAPQPLLAGDGTASSKTTDTLRDDSPAAPVAPSASRRRLTRSLIGWARK